LLSGSARGVLLPDHCSIRADGRGCQLPPSYVVSVTSEEGEYMLTVVCDDHRTDLEEKLTAMQKAEKIPKGRIRFESIKTVATDCVMGINEDYIDVELDRGIQSERKLD
jgi:hypothetical protein